MNKIITVRLPVRLAYVAESLGRGNTAEGIRLALERRAAEVGLDTTQMKGAKA